MAGGEAATSTADELGPPTHRQHDKNLAVSRNSFHPALPPLDYETSPYMLMRNLAWWYPREDSS
jgi:hypothetical protein